ncbi:ribosome assembly cofactor RimP [Paracrocinitomix mangrovi]|uniref:ribosome assembly cofactor RimP n=1 Tax=Paracrocinitomix mangrovi TaxID=2862509 RepID=UPI001C8D18A2|nr:ribosome assembly cofactor RimP [Paracrocinitomix mangrovi]UKN00865.1 ribosome assembly cofactor RimP [Paracrocinitomix mangrovi]
MIAKELVKSLVEERIAERDEKLYIVDIIIRNGNQILIELDKEDGAVSIEDCIAISRNVEHNLDRDQEDFSLEVSSAGMTNPFKVTKQYLKNVGREVKVQLFEHGKSIEGTLLSADDEGIIIEKKEKVKVEGKKKKEWVTTEIPLKYVEIKETKLQISF